MSIPKNSRKTKGRLLFYDEIPHWQRDNEHLLYGYRPTSGSWFLSFKSVFAWHNETVNIHLHVIGCTLFVWLPFHFCDTVYKEIDHPQPVDAILFTLYFLSVAVCFGCSACCHIIWNLSAPAARFGNRLDFSGIVLLMWGASIPSIHYAFVCNAILEYLHCSLVTISAAGCIVFTLNLQFLGPAFRKYRALMYASFGLSALLFMTHGILLYGFALQKKRLALEWMILMGALNIIGACCYASRLPEKWFPHRFDFVSASHQIFHLLVLAAALVHYKALVIALRESRVSHNSCIVGDNMATGELS